MTYHYILSLKISKVYYIISVISSCKENYDKYIKYIVVRLQYLKYCNKYGFKLIQHRIYILTTKHRMAFRMHKIGNKINHTLITIFGRLYVWVIKYHPFVNKFNIHSYKNLFLQNIWGILLGLYRVSFKMQHATLVLQASATEAGQINCTSLSTSGFNLGFIVKHY